MLAGPPALGEVGVLEEERWLVLGCLAMKVMQ